MRPLFKSAVFKKALSLTGLLAFSAGMLAAGWHRWADVLIDQGHQLYAPWRVSQGEHWHRDLLTYYGPFSIYAHALAFRIFGVTIDTLVGFNLAVVGIAVFCWRRLFGPASSERTLTLLSLAFLSLAALANFRRVGNSNFISPYSYELTHGMVLALVCLCAFRRSLGPAYLKTSLITGLALGAVFLCKMEVFFPLAAALGAGLVLECRQGRLAPRAVMARAAVSGAAAIAAIAAAVALLSTVMPAAQALEGIGMQYAALARGGLLELPFYRRLMGLDALPENLLKMAACAAGTAAFVWLFRTLVRSAADRAGRACLWASGLAVLAGFITVTAGYFPVVRGLLLHDLFRGLPLFMLAVAADTARSPERRHLFPVAVFSLLVLSKVVFNTHLYHLGFAVAVPSALFLFWYALEVLPNAAAGERSRRAARGAVALAVVGILFFYTEISVRLYSAKNEKISTRADYLYDYGPPVTERAAVIQDTIDYLEAELGPEETVTVLPEGVMLNYLIRRRNPSRFLYWNPTQTRFHDEREVVADLERARPDRIVTVDRDASEHGSRAFGTDYGVLIAAWIRERYVLERVFGGTPFEGEGFGTAVYRRARA